MKGLKFKLIKKEQSNLGYDHIQILDRFLHSTEQKLVQGKGKVTTYNYVLDCLCPGYEQIRQDEFFEEVCLGIYELEV